MARQKGILNLEGKAGTLSFFQGRDGYKARQSNGMNGKRILEDDAFIRTRENGAEFGRAGKAGKLLRTALRTLTLNVADSRVTGRMTKEMLKVIQSDPVNDRGERSASFGNANLLNGFEFNINTPLTQTFLPQFRASIDGTTGIGQVILPAFIPQKMISAPKGATHYSFMLGIVAVDFEEEETSQAFNNSEPLELTPALVAETALTVSLPEASDLPTFLVFGIEFVQIVNGNRYSLNNTQHNALAIVAVDSDI